PRRRRPKTSSASPIAYCLLRVFLLRAIGFAQQLTRNLGLCRGVVLRDHRLILLDSLVPLAHQVVELPGGKLSALTETELSGRDTGRELIILERLVILLLSPQALGESERREFDMRASVAPCLSSAHQLLIARD